MVGRRLVGLAGLVVPAPGEPLLALPAGLGPALHVPLADLGLRRSSSPLQPGDREAALADQQHAPVVGRRDAARKPAGSGRPSYVRSKGSRAVNVDPSAAAPVSAPSLTPSPVAPCRPWKFRTQRSKRSAGTDTGMLRR